MSSEVNTPFDRNKSVLKDVYIRFDANDPGELKSIYMGADQALMERGQWDYKNSSQLPNQITQAIEKVGLAAIRDKKEELWVRDILWMWYHHAISCALWRYGDIEVAQQHSSTALTFQPKGHPNKITRLLYHLVRDELEDAERWAKTITEEPEKTTAKSLLERYHGGNFFK